MILRILTVSLALVFAFAPAEGAKRHRKGVVPIPPELSGNSKSGGATEQYAPRQKAGSLEGTAEEPTVGNPDGPSGGPSLSNLHCEEKHPIETFMQISSAVEPQAAPNGGVYFLSDLRDAPQVFYLSSENAWPEQVSFFPDGVSYFKLSPDGKKLLLASGVGGDEQYDLYLLEPQTKKLTPLLIDRAKRVQSVAWESGARWFVYTSNARNKTDMDLYKFELAKMKSELVTDLTGHNSVTDVSPDGKLVALTTFRSVADSDVAIWNLAAKSLNVLTRHNGEGAYEEGRFTADSRGIFLLTDEVGGVRQVQLFSLAPNTPARPVTSGKWEIEDLALDSRRLSLAYVTNQEGYSRIEGFEIDRAGRRGAIISVPKIPGASLRSPSFGSGGFFFSQTSSTRSSDIWHWKNPKKTQWTRSTQGLTRAECFTTEKLVRYPSFDKLEIPAFVYYPRDAQGPIPFVVYVHGGPESQYRPVFSKIFQYFLERGFGVFAPNVRGSMGYGRSYSLLDNYKKRMDSVRDVIEGAKWLVANRYSSTGKLAIFGGSYGGFTVLRSIEVEPELFSAAAESVGITNFVTFLKNTKPYRRALREVEYGPLSDEEFLKSISPVTYVDKIKTPLLVFHGANDPRVPVSETEAIVKELQKRAIPVEFKIFPDEGHGNTKLRDVMEQAKTTVYFFEKHLGKK